MRLRRWRTFGGSTRMDRIADITMPSLVLVAVDQGTK
jgi:hypothetical protein